MTGLAAYVGAPDNLGGFARHYEPAGSLSVGSDAVRRQEGSG
jgi:hypothetical protein